MKKPISGSNQNPAHNNSKSSDQEPVTKWRPVFGQKLPPGYVPPNHAVKQTPTSKSSAKADSGRKAKPVPKAKPVSFPDYFAKMDPTERILFAYTVYKQPQDWSIDEFYGYRADSFRYLDNDLAGPGYHDVAKILTKWTKVGLLTDGSYNDYHSLAEGAAAVFWQWLEKLAAPEILNVEPEQTYTADLSGTLDNILNFLVLVEQEEVLITRNNELNKYSLKRILAALKEPTRPDKFFSRESYFLWIFSIVEFLQLVWPKDDHLVLTPLGRELPDRIKVENILCRIFTEQLRSIRTKGFFLVFSLLPHFTGWTSWAQMVNKLIAPAEDAGNLLRLDRVISILEPLRFLGLLDYGIFQKDILVRTTPLGQLLFCKVLDGQSLDECAGEIKILTDQVYPLEGPDTAYVQPNFEILLPRTVSWTVRWQLGQFAVLEQQDQMLKYRLDKTCLLKALKRGLPSDEVLSVLTKLSTYPLPENLVLTVRQWLESYGQVTFMRLCLLECTTPEQAAAIVSARKYKEYVCGLYSPTAVIVREPEKLRKLLEKQGIYPLTGILEGKEAAIHKGLLKD
jgi:hypothetical protein